MSPPQQSVEVPANVPDDPQEAYLKGFRDASMYFADAAATVADTVEFPEEQTAFHDDEEDDPECPECGSEDAQWSPSSEGYHCRDCGTIFEED